MNLTNPKYRTKLLCNTLTLPSIQFGRTLVEEYLDTTLRQFHSIDWETAAYLNSIKQYIAFCLNVDLRQHQNGANKGTMLADIANKNIDGMLMEEIFDLTDDCDFENTAIENWPFLDSQTAGELFGNMAQFFTVSQEKFDRTWIKDYRTLFQSYVYKSEGTQIGSGILIRELDTLINVDASTRCQSRHIKHMVYVIHYLIDMALACTQIDFIFFERVNNFYMASKHCDKGNSYRHAITERGGSKFYFAQYDKEGLLIMTNQ